MALILGDVYRETKQQFQLRLVAGETGLGNVLKWVSVVEDASTFGFLRGGELLLTTGVVLCNQPGGLIHFLRRAVSRGTCGMIVNIGKYIGTENITQEVIDFCEEQQYPLFLLPWHIPFYDFTWEYYNRIFLDSRRNEEISSALICLLNPHLDHQDALARLEESRLRPHAPYLAAVMSLEATGGSPPKRSTSVTDNSWLVYQFDRLMTAQSFACHLVLRRASCLFVCQTADQGAVEALLRQAMGVVQERYSELSPFVGLGGQVESLTELYKSYQQALGALKLGQYKGKPLTCYEELGFWKVLLAVSDREALQTFADQRLRAVREYDRLHKRDFSKTLELYLLHQGSVQEVAKASFCHRNTVLHRLQILTEQLGYRLDDPTERFELMAAFWVEEYLKFGFSQQDAVDGTHIRLKE